MKTGKPWAQTDQTRTTVEITTAALEDVVGIQDVLYRTWLATYPSETFGINVDDIEEMYKDRNSEDHRSEEKHEAAGACISPRNAMRAARSTFASPGRLTQAKCVAMRSRNTVRFSGGRPPAAAMTMASWLSDRARGMGAAQGMDEVPGHVAVEPEGA